MSVLKLAVEAICSIKLKSQEIKTLNKISNDTNTFRFMEREPDSEYDFWGKFEIQHQKAPKLVTWQGNIFIF